MRPQVPPEQDHGDDGRRDEDRSPQFGDRLLFAIVGQRRRVIGWSPSNCVMEAQLLHALDDLVAGEARDALGAELLDVEGGEAEPYAIARRSTSRVIGRSGWAAM